MSQLYLWMKQSGYGCDYTIGCGEKLIELSAETIEDAKSEVLSIMIDYGVGCGGEELADTKILAVADESNDILQRLQQDAEEAEQEAETRDKKKRIKELQRELAKLEKDQ